MTPVIASKAPGHCERSEAISISEESEIACPGQTGVPLRFSR
jgi:hypothetical protein